MNVSRRYPSSEYLWWNTMISRFSSLLVEQPVVTRNEAVVLVGLAVAFLPLEELAAGDADPRDKAIGSDLGLRGPRAHEVDDRIARVVGNPAPGQGPQDLL
jgi:hypothetical protein